MVPEAHLLQSGPRGKEQRNRTLQKHKAIIDSLTLIRVDDIRAIDTAIKHNGTNWTLRSFIHSITYPITPEEGTAPKRLFHSIDRATTGRDATYSITYFTAYNDRANLVEQLTQILPALVNYKLNKDALKAWFHESVHETIHEIIFDVDPSGNWNGKWTTSDDEITQAILDEDVGIELNFDINFDEEQNTRTILTTDQASVDTYGNAFGVTNSNPDTQVDASDSIPDSETAAPEGGGSSV
jgi:hypothetical protein